MKNLLIEPEHFKSFDQRKIPAAFKNRKIALFFDKNGHIVKSDDPILTTNTIF